MLMIKISNKSSVKRTALILFTLLFAYTLISCSGKKAQGSQQSKIESVNLVYNLPIINLSGEFANYTDSFAIFRKGPFRLYRFTYLVGSILKEGEDSTKAVEASTANTAPRYEYFIFRAGDRHGFRYDSLAAVSSQQLNVDSFLAVKAFTTIKVYDSTNDSLVGSVYRSGTLIETYLPKVKLDESYNDTTLCYYTNTLPDVGYSLSNELESTKKRKLNKVRLIYNPFGKLPRRELSLELKMMRTETVNGISFVFERLEKKYFLN
jgi:hypothetical protein